MKIQVSEKAKNSIKNFTSPEKLGFGTVIAPVMAVCDYDNGQWGDVTVEAYEGITLDPTNKTLHYGQEIFEGMKAYFADKKGPFLFRPYENAKRFNSSAARMAMPSIPEEVYVESVKTVVELVKDFIPSQSGDSLYIRPFMFATEDSLGIKPSDKFKFMVVASPSSSYFSGGSIKVLVERERFRAFPGGTGAAKTGGNYAAGLLAQQQAKQKGFDQSMWLDAIGGKNIEELSGMNFFCVINGELYTPEVSDTILDGITRKSLIDLARANGLTVYEKSITIDDLITKIKSNECTEAFACGTAAVITPINLINDGAGVEASLKESFGPITKKLRSHLLDIQEGRVEGPDGWVVKVD